MLVLLPLLLDGVLASGGRRAGNHSDALATVLRLGVWYLQVWCAVVLVAAAARTIDGEDGAGDRSVDEIIHPQQQK